MSLLLLIVNREGEPGEEPAATGECTFTYNVDQGATYAPDTAFTYAPEELYTYDPCADD